MARHPLRLIVWLVGGMASLALLAALGLAVMLWGIDPNVYRGRIENAASDALGRRVELTGALRWRPGLNFQIESRGGRIANAPGFEAASFASWQALNLGVALRPLLQRRLVVDRIEVQGLSLNLARTATGVNWIFSPRTPTRPSDSLQLAIGRIALRKSRVSFTDEIAGRAWSATELDLELRLPASLAASTLSFDQLSMRARLMGAPVIDSGVVVAFQANRTRFTPASNRLLMPEWKLQWGEAKLSGGVDASVGDALKLTGALQASVPSLRQLLQSISMALPATRDTAVFGLLELAAHFEMSGSTAALSGIDGKLDATHFDGSVSLPRLTPLSLRFELNADEVNADRYRAPDNSPSEPFQLPLAELKSLDAKGSLKIKRAIFAGADARELRIDVD